MSIPYASASTGTKAREEITKILRRFGCESVGFMDDYGKGQVLLAFTHRGRQIQLPASAKGWAQMFLKENPWTIARTARKQDYEQKPLRQGHIAVNSILRDWIKGQMTAVECGILQFRSGVHALHVDDRWSHRDRTARGNQSVARTGRTEGCSTQITEGATTP